MQIQLKQVEIEKAIRAYITNLGIDLLNKTVTIAFTSGRKDNGLSADVEFEDNKAIPGFTDAPVMRVVTPEIPQALQASTDGSIKQAETTDDSASSGKVSLFNKPV